MSFDFRVLGSIELRRDGEGLVLGPAKRRIMFAALLLDANRPVSLSRLGQALWGETPPRSATANLRTHAGALRIALRHPVRAGICRLVGERLAYRMVVKPGESDVGKFVDLSARGRQALGRGEATEAVRHLGASLALWRGVAGEGLPSGTILDAHLGVLNEQRLAVFEDYIQARIAIGECVDVVSGLRRHLGQNPLRERAWGQLMTALYGTGCPASALGAYAEARSVLLSELGLEPGPELRALQRQILDREVSLNSPAREGVEYAKSVASGLAAQEPAAVRVIAATPVRQLPARTATLFGRDNELTLLRSALAVGGGRVGPAAIAVHGPPGVGTSALAIHAAHDAADSFPDGQLYADLCDPAGEPIGPEWVLARFLRALGVAGPDIPADLGERAALYRSLLADRRILIVLDNAEDAGQVRPLLPASPGCAIVVASHCGLSTLNVHRSVSLPALATGDAVVMITDLIGADRVAAEPVTIRRVVGLCDHNPLALRVAGARLANRPASRLRELARRLANGRTRLDELSYEGLSMRASMARCYQVLARTDTAAARVFRALGRGRSHDITEETVAELAGLAVAEAARALDALEDFRLIESPTSGRYRIPELHHLYAAELVRDADIGAGPRSPRGSLRVAV